MRLLNQILSAAAITTAILTNIQAQTQFSPSDNKKLAVEYTINGNIDDDFFEFTKDPLADIGFYLNDPHHNVNVVYEQQVGATSLEQLAFSSLVNDNKARELMNIDPRIGGFTPFNLVIYRKKSNHQTVITHIMPEAALDVLQITDKDVRSKFVEMFKPLDATIEAKYPKATKDYTLIQGFAEKTMMNFEIPFEEPEDIDDFFDEFQETFESSFETKGYIIAGFYNMKYSLNTEADVLPDYAQYVVWSLCHVPFSYTIFDGKNPIPRAAIFAPCSMYAYIKPGENKIVIGMPTLTAWASALGITDKDKLAKIAQLDTEIPAIIHSLGGIDTDNTNPLAK
ncbi:hypothetical protein GJV85_12805 [Sulfurimonas aquatica]|uniref:DUF302 domain-containing protein n=1 Tax=Sulfurimonas aquatica TaxID=2672570 RepID=A0A975B2C2_9BACT|nr:hypothetical protein [Sulfurimonas aquatica]QSZ42949.1 hypothetical protein GJV85_12805 [Sulfurimonas aquatica]